jgi:phosphate transport system permease protein
VRKAKEVAFVLTFLASIGIALLTLGILLAAVLQTAWPFLGPQLLFNYANTTDPATAGFAAAIVGSLWIVGLTLLFSLPLGIAAGVYLEEYAPKNRITRLLEAGVSNLAGVPSVVFGLLGLALFVRPPLSLGPVVLAGALTLSILVFPYVVIVTQEAVRAVPPSIRDAALALGATKWQTIYRQVLPAASPGLLTGAILTASRALGETAPLIVIGAVFLQTFLPDGPSSLFVALPVQIWGFTEQPPRFHGVAAGGIVILLAMLFSFNIVAIVVRNRLQRTRW